MPFFRWLQWQVREALHVKFVPSAQNPTGKPDYEGNTYKYWHAGQNNSGWNYVSLVLLLAATVLYDHHCEDVGVYLF